MSKTKDKSSGDSCTVEDDSFKISDILPMRSVQDRYIEWVMLRCNKDQKVAAEKLGISSKTIYNRYRYGNVQNPE